MEKDKAIRNLYQEKGVENYYQEEGATYENPHFKEIRTLIIQNKSRIDYRSVLDFCCGNGEVSLVLKELGFDATASDPFTQKAYEVNFNKPCLDYSFKSVIKGELKGQFSAVICSFAMHLCPEKQLYPLVHNLFQHSPLIVIITPHKRPELEKLSNVELAFEDFTLTPRGKKVRLKGYQLIG